MGALELILHIYSNNIHHLSNEIYRKSTEGIDILTKYVDISPDKLLYKMCFVKISPLGAAMLIGKVFRKWSTVHKFS